MEGKSDIAKWYSGKGILITGATGFMGKVLVEKLLRSCPDAGPIYILVRGKKEMLPRDRIDEIMTSGAFEKVRSLQNNRDKCCIVPIPGDICLPDLGISAEDNRLLKETVSVVFHLAATVRFNEPMRTAVGMNLVGTKTLLEMCRNMPKLSAIVHVSTAYTNCNRYTIGERVYPPPADPEKILHCVAGLDDDLLELVTPRLLDGHPNTYTFTKALAEHMVAGYSNELPIVVLRPSIVTCAWKEPNPGWVDSWNGATGLILGAGKGLVKSVYGKSELIADLIPVDVCINLCIAAAWEIGTRESAKLVPDVRVYNCVSRPHKSMSWTQFVRIINDCTRNHAMKDTFPYPNVRMTSSRLRQKLIDMSELYPFIIMADIHLWLLGKKPRHWRCLNKLKALGSSLEFFTNHEFEFDVNNVDELKRRLTPVDRTKFDFDITQLNWDKYITTYFMGIKENVIKEENKPTSEKRLVRWKLMKKVAQIGALAIFVISYFRINLSRNIIWSDFHAFG